MRMARKVSCFLLVLVMTILPIGIGNAETIGEKNALRMAKEYLETMAFSYSGLIAQLEFEGFTHEEAQYAAAICFEMEEELYPELSVGSKGENVVKLQTRLQELGFYNIKIDGDYGPGTANAVKEFEKSKNLPETGIATTELQIMIFTNDSIEEISPDSTEYNYADGYVSPAQDAYIIASTLTVNDLTTEPSGLSNNKKDYYYKDLRLLSDDVQWIENWLNTKGTINHGAIYRKLTYLYRGFYMRAHNGEDCSEWIFGIKTNSRDEFAEYADRISALITEDDPKEGILNTFSTINSIDGEFDFDNGIFNFTINDLSQCAAEIGICEEMLGYTLAALDEYGATTDFAGNTATVSLTIVQPPMFE